MSRVVQESREPGHVPIARRIIRQVVSRSRRWKSASVLEYGENAARNYFVVHWVYAGSCADRCRGHTSSHAPITAPEVDIGPAEENGRPSPRIVYRDITDTTKSDSRPLYPSILPASSAATGIQRTRDSFLNRHLASSLHKTPLMPGDHAQWSQWQWRRPWRYAQRLRAMAAMRVRATITRNGGDDTCSDYA